MKAAVFYGKHNLKIEELEAPRPNADEVAVVIGCGMIGLIMLRFVKNAGAAKVIAIDATGTGDAFIGSFLYNLYRNGYERNTLESITEKELELFVKQSNDYCAKSVQKPGAIESYPDTL